MNSRLFEKKKKEIKFFRLTFFIKLKVREKIDENFKKEFKKDDTIFFPFFFFF